MTKQEIMTNCLKQMIFDEFLSLYGDAIKVLLRDQSILYTVRKIHQGVSEQIEFCADNSSLELRKFKNNIGEMFYESQAYFHIPEYRFIVDDVKKKVFDFAIKAVIIVEKLTPDFILTSFWYVFCESAILCLQNILLCHNIVAYFNI